MVWSHIREMYWFLVFFIFFLLFFVFCLLFVFFFNDTATTEIYTLSLHDALPICPSMALTVNRLDARGSVLYWVARAEGASSEGGELPTPSGDIMRIPFGQTTAEYFWTSEDRSEEHTSELQSRTNLVCRLLLEKKKKTKKVIKSKNQ